MAQADSPITDGLPTVRHCYAVLNSHGLEVPPAVLTFVLAQAAAAVLLRCARLAMLAVLLVAFILAGPLDDD
jgi:hypothetical protein